jgi:hypothetical protein
MHSYQMELIAEEHRRERAREAAHERLVREARAARAATRGPRGGGSRRPSKLGLAWLGRSLAGMVAAFRCPDGGAPWTA